MVYKKLQDYLFQNNCKFFHLDSVDSTMIEAKKILSYKNQDFIIISDTQTDGKGRRGNDWISPNGNIYCSIVLKNSFSLDNYFFFSMLVSTCVKKTLSKFGAENVQFKWPNDLMYNNAKFAGMILESFQDSAKSNYVIIGLGINFYSSPSIINYKTTYVNNFITIKKKNIFLESFFEYLFYYWKNYALHKENIISEFNSSLMYLDKKITINKNAKDSIRGIFKGINNDGSLILESNNDIISIYSGSIGI